MVDRSHKPAAIDPTPEVPERDQIKFRSESDRVAVELASGDSCEVLFHGATVISWKDSKGNERLWLSKAAKLDGSKPVRGGIPLVFPVFGKCQDRHMAELPQHGFARNVRWEFFGKATGESAAGDQKAESMKLDFSLSSRNLPEDVRKQWPFDFSLLYSVTLEPQRLTTKMVVINAGDKAFEAQLLMHSYFRVKDISQTKLVGLKSAQYHDKVQDAKEQTQDDTELCIDREVDRVYTPRSKDAAAAYDIVEGGKKSLSIKPDDLADVVVWNPWTEKAAGMVDFEPKDGFKQMLCVEVGQLDSWIRLEPNDQFEGGQTITLCDVGT